LTTPFTPDDFPGSLRQILVNRFNRMLAKKTGIKGPNPSSHLHPIIHPVLPIDHSRAEDEATREVIWSAKTAGVAAGGAGTFVGVGVRNPAGSGKVVVVTDAWVSNGNMVIGYDNVGTVDLQFTIGSQLALDSRFRFAQVAVQFGTTGATPPAASIATTAHFRIGAAAGAIAFLTLGLDGKGVPLYPGNIYWSQHAAAATGFDSAGFLVYERPFDASELNP
jgi:hypothetical protein